MRSESSELLGGIEYTMDGLRRRSPTLRRTLIQAFARAASMRAGLSLIAVQLS